VVLKRKNGLNVFENLSAKNALKIMVSYGTGTVQYQYGTTYFVNIFGRKVGLTRFFGPFYTFGIGTVETL